MKTSKSRVFSLICAVSLLVSMIATVGVLPAAAENGVVVFQDFENGTEGFHAWMVDSNATWSMDESAPLNGGCSLKMSTANAAGCYVTFPAGIGVHNVALRLKVTGNNGIVRINANGSDAHSLNDELTTSAIVYTDLAGNVLENVAFYDTNWNGIRFNADFDGYVFLHNENNVNISSINLGIYHGSTNEVGMVLQLDDFAVFSGDNYAAIAKEIGGIVDEGGEDSGEVETPADVPAAVVEDFENGTDGFHAWLVDGSIASWGIESEAALAGDGSLKLHTYNGIGCYVTFPAAIGVQNIALRLQVTGNTGIVRVGANGTDCHGVYDELTNDCFVVTDVAGNVLPDIAYYDAAWGGIRFSGDFDGYLFLENEYGVDIECINVGIYHGSTNEFGMTLLFDDLATYAGTDYAAIVAAIAGPVEEALFSAVQDFEKGTDGFNAWLVDSSIANWGIESEAALSGNSSLKLQTSNAVGCYVTFPAAVGVKNLALRVKVIGNTGIVRIGANGNDCHAVYDELTTSEIVFMDATGNVLGEDVAFYDAAWGGIRFNYDFDGYVFLKNEYEVSIGKINVGIYHGSTNEVGMTLLIDDVIAYGEHTEETMDAIVLATHAHIWNDATCTTPKTCAVCGETDGEAPGHAYFYPCDAHCMNCGELTNPDAAHTIGHVDGVEATCTENGNIEYWYCADCGAAWADEALTQVTNRMSIVTFTDHVYENGTCKWCAEADPNAPVEEGKLVATATKSALTFNVYAMDGGYKLVVSGTGSIAAWTDMAIYTDYAATIKTLVIEEGITEVGSSAFANLTALESVEFSSTVTNLAYGAFLGTGLKEVTIPDSVKTMGKWVFANCKSLTTAVVGNGLKILNERTFSGCSNLKSVTLGTKIYTVGSYNFYNTALESVYIPANVKILDQAVFRGCTSLKTVEIADGGVKSIGWASFYKCSALESIDFGTNLTTIGAWNFTVCNKLTEIVIPDTVTSLGRCAFKWCASLKKVTLGAGITKVQDEMFAGCLNLTDVILSENVTSIGAKAFYKCKALTSVVIPEGADVAADAFTASGIK